ncbi:MAG: hypothetical protein ACTTKP_01695 [Catonella sp.]|uniref:hypothetical protein n=1 Tax=Catonella sp. TaxID=2382125 RepID=UPI003FA15301
MKDVEEYMISAGLLALLAVIDYMKKEIHILVLVPVIIIWLIMPVWNNSISISSIVAAGILIGFSLAVKQALGMADAIVLSLIAVTEGIFGMLIIFFIANIIFLIFAVIKLGFKQKNREYPFIPFIFVAFIMIKIIFSEGL